MKKENFFRKIYKSYFISPGDMAELAENNRIRLLIVCPIVFLFGIGNFFIIILSNRSNIHEYKLSLLYFGIYTISAFIAYIYSIKIKDCPKEKALILKNIPLYCLYYETLFASIYNFYILKQPFNGFVIFCLICCIILNLFSFSPLFFLLGQIIVLGFMGSGLYENFGLKGLSDAILITVVIFCLVIYKRNNEKRSIIYARKQKNILTAKTFGNFTLIYDNKVVKFARTKSNELMGYLIYKNGSSVNTKELISVLWGDRADSARYGSNLRNLIVDIKHSFGELEIQNFFIAEYNNFRINPKAVKCDYYDFLAGDEEAINSYSGEFMSQYSWAEAAAAFLDMKVLKK